jgi:uncharacterized membrane protein
MKNELNTKKFFNALAFAALVLSGLALIVSKILGWLKVGVQFAGILSSVASSLAYIVTAVAAYYYVRTKRSVTWIVIYIVALLLVIVPIVLSMFNI